MSDDLLIDFYKRKPQEGDPKGFAQYVSAQRMAMPFTLREPARKLRDGNVSPPMLTGGRAGQYVVRDLVTLERKVFAPENFVQQYVRVARSELPKDLVEAMDEIARRSAPQPPEPEPEVDMTPVTAENISEEEAIQPDSGDSEVR